jgi:hypothetical protein
MNVYISAVSSEKQYAKTLDSFYEMDIREGDIRGVLFGRPGFIARMDLCDAFLKDKTKDAILLVDLDMVIPRDGLEKLRAHDLDMVTGHYFRRHTAPIMSVCQVVDKENNQIPLVDVPDSGLHEIAATGFGFVLIKREVIEAVAKLDKISHPFAPGPVPEVGHYDIFGQDIRFFYYTRKLGYRLWLDAGVECKHATTFYTSKWLYDIIRPHQAEEWKKEWEDIKWVQKKTIKRVSENWRKLAKQ